MSDQPEPQPYEGSVAMHPVRDPYQVYLNVEGPMIPESEPGAHDGDYYWDEEGWLVLPHYPLDKGDLIQVLLGTRRQIYRFPEGATPNVKLLQVPVIEYKSRDEEPLIVT